MDSGTRLFDHFLLNAPTKLTFELEGETQTIYVHVLRRDRTPTELHLGTSESPNSYPQAQFTHEGVYVGKILVRVTDEGLFRELRVEGVEIIVDKSGASDGASDPEAWQGVHIRMNKMRLSSRALVDGKIELVFRPTYRNVEITVLKLTFEFPRPGSAELPR